MSDQMTVEIGQTMPIDLPDAGDGTPHTTPMMTCPWPLQIVLPADISPAHEQALMHASANGSTRRLICMQGHQRRLVSNADPSQMAWLPVMQVSLYLRGPSGPLHRPLHWIATANVLGDGEPHQTLLMHVMQQLADSPGKGVPVRLLVTGRDRRLLLIANLALHNDAAIVWAKALHLAVSGCSLRQDDFAEQWATAEADLLPCVERAGCMRPLMPVAIGGRRKAVHGGKLMAWLVTRGWLHPQQVPCEEGGGSVTGLVPIRQIGSHRKFSITATYQEICDHLGQPNVTDLDDAAKVSASWGFMEEKTGRMVFVWCYCVPDHRACNIWSADGDGCLLRDIFGDKVAP